MVMGMGFPAFRGGLIFWADLAGAGALPLPLPCRRRRRSPLAFGSEARSVPPPALCLPAGAWTPRQPVFASAPCPPSSPPLLPATDYICKRLDGWAQQFAGAGLEGFFKPCAYLQVGRPARSSRTPGRLPHSNAPGAALRLCVA